MRLMFKHEELHYTPRSPMSISNCFTMGNKRIQICYRLKTSITWVIKKFVYSLYKNCVDTLIASYLPVQNQAGTSPVSGHSNTQNLTNDPQQYLWFILIFKRIFKKWNLVLKTLKKAILFSLISHFLVCKNYFKSDTTQNMIFQAVLRFSNLSFLLQQCISTSFQMQSKIYKKLTNLFN